MSERDNNEEEKIIYENLMASSMWFIMRQSRNWAFHEITRKIIKTAVKDEKRKEKGKLNKETKKKTKKKVNGDLFAKQMDFMT